MKNKTEQTKENTSVVAPRINVRDKLQQRLYQMEEQNPSPSWGGHYCNDLTSMELALRDLGGDVVEQIPQRGDVEALSFYRTISNAKDSLWRWVRRFRSNE